MQTIEQHSICKVNLYLFSAWVWQPPAVYAVFLADIWIIYSLFCQWLPSQTTKKILCFRVLGQGVLWGCSNEWPKLTVHMRVWASKLELINVWVDDSSSSVPNVNFGAVGEAIGPTIVPIQKNKIKQHLANFTFTLLVMWITLSQSYKVITLSSNLLTKVFFLSTIDSTLHIWCIHSGSLHHPLNYLIGLTWTGMKINWLNSISLCLSTFWLFVYSVVFCSVFLFKLVSHADLNTRPVRTEPEGESSPLESDKPQRMEPAEKKHAEHGLTSHTNAFPLSTVSPASSILRSKRKEGKGIGSLNVWFAFILLLMQ